MIVFQTSLVILVLYSLIPFTVGSQMFAARIGGLPFTYLPFVMLFGAQFAYILLTRVLAGQRILLPKPLVVLTVFVLYLIAEIPFLKNLHPMVSVGAHMQEVIMFSFYIFAVFYGTVLTLYDKTLEQIDEMILTWLRWLCIIALISVVRYALVDRGQAIFFNLFNPLRYRLFEVLFLCIFFPLAACLTVDSRPRLTPFFLLFTALILTGSRTGYVAGIILIMFLLSDVLKNKKKFSKKVEVIVIVCLLCSIIVAGAAPIVKNRFEKMNRLTTASKLDFNESLEEQSDVKRVGLFLGSLKMFTQSPILGFGLGKDNFIYYFPNEYGKYIHIAKPHNLYVYLLATTGFIGFTLFILFLLLILLKGLKLVRNSADSSSVRKRVKYLCLALFIVFVTMMTEEYETSPLFWMLLGVVYAYFEAGTKVCFQALEGVKGTQAISLRHYPASGGVFRLTRERLWVRLF